jgi:hypothetical protein
MRKDSSRTLDDIHLGLGPPGSVRRGQKIATLTEPGQFCDPVSLSFWPWVSAKFRGLGTAVPMIPYRQFHGQELCLPKVFSMIFQQNS